VENPQAALKDFDLTSEEEIAVISGDVQFIESRIGTKLGARLMGIVDTLQFID